MTATRPEQDWFAKADEDLEMSRCEHEVRSGDRGYRDQRHNVDEHNRLNSH